MYTASRMIRSRAVCVVIMFLCLAECLTGLLCDAQAYNRRAVQGLQRELTTLVSYSGRAQLTVKPAVVSTGWLTQTALTRSISDSLAQNTTIPSGTDTIPDRLVQALAEGTDSAPLDVTQPFFVQSHSYVSPSTRENAALRTKRVVTSCDAGARPSRVVLIPVAWRSPSTTYPQPSWRGLIFFALPPPFLCWCLLSMMSSACLQCLLLLGERNTARWALP